jgi:hypothetical protein
VGAPAERIDTGRDATRSATQVDNLQNGDGVPSPADRLMAPSGIPPHQRAQMKEEHPKNGIRE